MRTVFYSFPIFLNVIALQDILQKITSQISTRTSLFKVVFVKYQLKIVQRSFSLWVNFVTFFTTVRVNKSVYIAKTRQWYYKTHKNILLHMSNHALKYMYMLNYGTIKKQFYYGSFISNFIVYFSLEYLWSHKFLVWKSPSSCLLNSLSADGWLIISVTWLINFQIVLRFYMSLSSVCLVFSN